MNTHTLRNAIRSALLLVALASPAFAQVALTHVTGTVVDATGTPARRTRLSITKVLKGGVVVSTKRIDLYTDASGNIDFNVLRNSTVYIEADVVGMDRPNGIALVIPDSATVDFSALLPTTSPPTGPLLTHAATPASPTQLGHVKCGTGTSCSGDGTLSVTVTGGATAHSELSGLSADDHPQYFNQARGDARYSQLGHAHAIADTTGLQAALDAKAAASHTHTLSQVTDAGTAAALNVAPSGDASSTQVVKGSDSRLTDSRTPTAHASSHAAAGSDPLTLSESQITNLPSDLAGKASASALSTHIADTSNPHGVTKNQVGLGNADNTSDANKPVSTAQAAAIATKQDALGYTAENSANKSTDLAADAASNIKYSTPKSIKDYFDAHSVTNSAGSSVIPKSNGTNLVASQMTDDGTTVTVPNNLSVDGYAHFFNADVSGSIDGTQAGFDSITASTLLTATAVDVGGIIKPVTAAVGVSTTAVGDVTHPFYSLTLGRSANNTATFGGTFTGNRNVTVPDATTTLVGTDATQTLTNKTISGASNTLTVRLASDVTGVLDKNNLPGTLNATSAPSLTVSGTTGSGFAEFGAQSSNPSAPSGGFRLFADSSGRFSWRRASDGFTRTFDATLTADRVYTLPDRSATVATSSGTLTSGNAAKFDASGNVVDGGVGLPAFAYVSGSDATTTGQSLVDVTGLSAALSANSTYEFTAVLYVTTSADASGTRYGVNYSAAGSTLKAVSLSGSRTSTAGNTEPLTALNTSSGSYMTTSGQSGAVVINGLITTGANAGNLTVQHLKISSGTSTVKIGSYLKVTKIS